MRRFFHTELSNVRSDLILMGRRSVDLLCLSLKALSENDPDYVEQVLAQDDEIDQLNITIDQEAIRYISLHSPVATDVRLLTVAMKSARDLERTADEAVSIAKRARRISENGICREFYHIPEMGDRVVEMMGRAIDSFVEENVEDAINLPSDDKKVDELNRENYELLTQYIAQRPDQSSSAVELMFISKSLERVGDHAKNIAEDVVYLLKGKDIRHTDKDRAETD